MSSRFRSRASQWFGRARAFWEVFRQSRLGLLGLAILLGFAGMAISAPFLEAAGILRDPNLIHEDASGRVLRLLSPSAEFPLGTDQVGRDLLSRVWFGSQYTLLIGIVATVISMGLGTIVGLAAGYAGGWIDEVLMRATDFFLVLPTLVLALILAVTLPPPGKVDLWKLVFVIAISLWASTARLVRAQVLTLKERQFVLRARAIGAGHGRIIGRHIFPNAFSLVFAEAILTIAVAILTESFLAFLNLAPDEIVTWGKVLQDALSHDALEFGRAMWVVAPGLLIVGLVFGFTLLGYALDELFNPRLRRR
jgi:peptide/nickel transport system permease protein